VSSFPRSLPKSTPRLLRFYVAAPVFGRPEVAASRKLLIVAAGPKNGIERCSPLFEALAGKTFVLGSTAAHANLVKLASNFLLFAMIESLGEAVAFARKTGLEPIEFVKIITETVFDSAAYRVYGPMIAQSKYEPLAFPLSMVLRMSAWFCLPPNMRRSPCLSRT